MNDSDTTNNSASQHQPPPAAGGEHLRLAFEAWWHGSGAHLPEGICASMSEHATVRRLCWLAWLEGQSYGLAQAQAIYRSDAPSAAIDHHLPRAAATLHAALDRAMRPL